LADKGAALERLGRHLMMFPTKPIIVNLTESLADIIQKARKRASAHLDLPSNVDGPGRARENQKTRAVPTLLPSALIGCTFAL